MRQQLPESDGEPGVDATGTGGFAPVEHLEEPRQVYRLRHRGGRQYCSDI